MGQAVRWGILGASKFAAEHMGPAIHEASGAVLAGVATSSPDKAGQFTSFAPDARIFESYDALLADPDIDAVYVPLPNHLHVDWTLKAIAAGKPVLTEKPVAMAADEIDKLTAARDASGIFATEALMIAHHPQWARAREILQSGEIGDLIHVHSIFTYDNRTDPGNIRNKSETGGGALPDIGVYPLGAARLVTGEAAQVTQAAITWENGVDVVSRVDAMLGQASFSFLVSMRMANRQEVTFHGDKGQLRITGPFNAGVFAEAGIEVATGTASRVERFPTVRQYRNQVEAFGRTIRDGTPYPWTLEHARDTQAALDAAFSLAGKG